MSRALDKLIVWAFVGAVVVLCILEVLFTWKGARR